MTLTTNALPAKGRDLRFDSLRGLLLVGMTINHLPSPLRVATDGGLGIFSSAEGFVFISGLVAGMVYTRRLRRDGPEALSLTVKNRVNMIYTWHVSALMIALLAVQVIERVWGYCSWTAPQLFFQNPWLGAILGTALLYQPGLFDILPMYCGFVLLLPFVLGALEKGRYGRVLTLSALAWFAVQWFPPLEGAPFYPINIGSFNLFSWQFLFVAGLAIGHVRVTNPAPQIPFRPWLTAVVGGLAVYFWGVQHLGWRPPWPDWFFGVTVNKPSLGMLRLGDFALVAYLVSLLGGRFPRLLTWPPLAFLGQHSLAVVAGQSLVVLVLLQFPSCFATPFRTSVATAVCVASLFAVAALHRRLSRKPAAGSEPLKSRPRPLLPLSRPHDAPAA